MKKTISTIEELSELQTELITLNLDTPKVISIENEGHFITTHGIITDEDATKCLEYIVMYAPKYAEAKANRVYMHEFRKTKRAQLFLKGSGTVAECQAYAESHDDYIQTLKSLKEATDLEEKYKWYLIAAQAKLEIYRTISANQRRATQ